MNYLLTLWNNPLIKKLIYGFVLLLIIVISFKLWLSAHDSATRADERAKLIATPAQVTTDTIKIFIPAKPTVIIKTPSNVISQDEHQRELDSAKAYWTSISADKDSLIAHYTENKNTSLVTNFDSTEVFYYPLGMLGSAEPESFKFIVHNKPWEQKIITRTETKYLPLEYPWYATRTACYFYGIATMATASYIQSKIK